MPTFRGFDAFNRELKALSDEFDGRRARKVLKPAVKAGKKAAKNVLPRDLGGDHKFSGWDAPFTVESKWTPSSAAVIHPTRNSAGPWRVADEGRNRGNVAGFSGPGINRRSGLTSRTKSGALRKTRSFKSKRWNGTTRGFGTGDKAAAAIDKAVEPIIDKQVLKVTKRRFDVS